MAEVKRQGRWVFYYDGECGFCTASVGLLARADFFRQVTWMAYQDLEAPPTDLTWEDLEQAAFLGVEGKEGQSRLYRGFYAFRMLTLRLPPLLPLAPFLWLPSVHRPGEAVYGWVAANRYRISRRCRLKAGR